MKVKKSSIIVVLSIALIVVVAICLLSRRSENFTLKSKPTNCNDFIVQFANGMSTEIFTPGFQEQINQMLSSSLRKAFSEINPVDKADYEKFLKEKNCGPLDRVGDSPLFRTTILNNLKEVISKMN